MPVDSKHPKYLEMEPTWRKAKAFATSEEAVHARGEQDLPRLSEQTDEEYASYLARASLSALFKKTAMTYAGLATRVPATVANKKAIEEYMSTCSIYGKSFAHHTYEMLKERFAMSRCGTLIDMPAGNSYVTPSFILYDCLSIINWDSDVIDGKEVLTMVVLTEQRKKEDREDVFDQKTETHYRVLILEDGVYHSKLYNKDLLMLSDVIPEENNAPMNYIPFVMHGGIKVRPLDLGEILDLNLHHYQVSADQMHGLHFCGLPTPWVSGVAKDEAPSFIGPTRFVVLEDPDSNIGMLEFTGQGLQPIADKIQQLERTIAALSATSLERTGRVTATQSNIDANNDTASLAGMVNESSEELTKAMNFALSWQGKENTSIQLTTEFTVGKMSAQELLALTQAYLSGSISFETYWTNLVQGELGNPHKTHEEEQDDIVITPGQDTLTPTGATEEGSEEEEEDEDSTDDSTDENAE